jgi:hypothetical protein
MSIFTDRELEFLMSLRTSWRRLYCNELARLLKEHDSSSDARNEAPCVAQARRDGLCAGAPRHDGTDISAGRLASLHAAKRRGSPGAATKIWIVSS